MNSGGALTFVVLCHSLPEAQRFPGVVSRHCHENQTEMIRFTFLHTAEGKKRSVLHANAEDGHPELLRFLGFSDSAWESATPPSWASNPWLIRSSP